MKHRRGTVKKMQAFAWDSGIPFRTCPRETHVKLRGRAVLSPGRPSALETPAAAVFISLTHPKVQPVKHRRERAKQ